MAQDVIYPGEGSVCTWERTQSSLSEEEILRSHPESIYLSPSRWSDGGGGEVYFKKKLKLFGLKFIFGRWISNAFYYMKEATVKILPATRFYLCNIQEKKKR